MSRTIRTIKLVEPGQSVEPWQSVEPGQYVEPGQSVEPGQPREQGQQSPRFKKFGEIRLKPGLLSRLI